MVPVGRAASTSRRSLTFSERSRDRIAYLTLFPSRQYDDGEPVHLSRVWTIHGSGKCAECPKRL